MVVILLSCCLGRFQLIDDCCAIGETLCVKTMPDTKEHKYYVEVTVAYEPTEFDKVGCDGVFVKSVNTLDSKSVELAKQWIASMNRMWDA